MPSWREDENFWPELTRLVTVQGLTTDQSHAGPMTKANPQLQGRPRTLTGVGSSDLALRSFSLARRKEQGWNIAKEGGCEIEQNKPAERNDAAPTAGREQVDGNQRPPSEEYERAKIVWQLASVLLSVGENPKCDAAGQKVGGKNGCDCCKAWRRTEAFVQTGCGKTVEQGRWRRE